MDYNKLEQQKKAIKERDKIIDYQDGTINQLENALLEYETFDRCWDNNDVKDRLDDYYLREFLDKE